MHSSRKHGNLPIRRGTPLMHSNSGYIVDGLGEDGWRWGYGMFAVRVSRTRASLWLILFLYPTP